MAATQPVSTPSDHRHLSIVKSAPPTISRALGARWTAVGLAALAVGLYAVSFFCDWWHFTLFAPQYPKGLTLHVGLRGMTGDVHEIDILNHYIGMKHLEDAAPFEREMAGWGVGLLGFLVFALTLLPGKRVSAIMMLPALAFPITFILDSMYWLTKFGQHLDPHAPLHFKPFTPHMFGLGIIGQFRTWAVPGPGFVLACSSVVLLAVALVLRRRVCNQCAHAGSCGVVCKFALIGPHAGEPKAAQGE